MLYVEEESAIQCANSQERDETERRAGVLHYYGQKICMSAAPFFFSKTVETFRGFYVVGITPLFVCCEFLFSRFAVVLC